MQFWQGVIGLSALAVIFVLWPTVYIRKKYKEQMRAGDNSGELNAVYDEQIEDLQLTQSRGELGDKEYESLKHDLEKTLVEETVSSDEEIEAPVVSSLKSKAPLFVIALVIPLLALAMYAKLGAKEDWEIYQAMVESGQAGNSNQHSAGELISLLQERLKDEPKNINNWYLLATTAMNIEEYDESVRAYKEVLKLDPESPRIMAELAQALFSRAGNTVTPEVRFYTQETLKRAPMIPTALGLAGVDAFQAGDHEKAIQYWQRALSVLDPSSAAYQVLSSGVSRAQAAIEESGGTVSKVEEVVAAPELLVELSVGDEVSVSATDQVFVYARAWKGPKMPLVIERFSAAELPKKVRLHKSMMEGMNLNSFPQVEVVARISSTGGAIPQAGDWEATFGPVTVATQKESIKLIIEKMIQ